MTRFRLEDLDYELPPERIAQRPAEPRDAARLLVLDRRTGALAEHRFAELPELLGPEDLVVVNDTRVVPAKLRGRKPSGGRVELLALEWPELPRFRALVRGRAPEGTELLVGPARLRVEGPAEGGARWIAILDGAPHAAALLEAAGEPPLPPYIRRPAPLAADRLDYQSVFARVPGSVAAPTASLHFTEAMRARLRIATVTLHVGPGTFRLVRSEDPSAHRVDPERFEVPEATAEAIAATRRRGGRIVAVGTTVVRALETTGGAAGRGETGLTIWPGYRFRIVDELVTNFHLPRSSLLGLVMAFAGVEPVRRAYAYAIEKGFRFYSYGDAMWIR